jgi:signal peptidase I
MRGQAGFAHFSPGSFLLGIVVTLLIVWVALSFRLARVTGDAMAPTYVSGDVVLVRAFDYQDRRPRRGDVALLYYPLDPEKLMIHRVISTEGDTLQIFDGHVYVNDAPVADDRNILTSYRSHEDWGPLVTPQGYYFVIGDHRNASSDSRHWGFVPRRYLWGKVVARLAPWRSRS